MIDPQLKYCPGCNSEYRSEIEVCATCHISLITGAEKLAEQQKREQKIASRQLTLSKDDDLVLIHRGQLVDLKKIEKRLVEENIGCLLVGDKQSCGKGCCPSVFELMIRRQDASDVAEIIEDEFNRATHFNSHDTSRVNAVFDDRVESTICPACGFSFPTTTKICPDCGLCFG